LTVGAKKYDEGDFGQKLRRISW